jgi:putative membrane protein insertion efficiency factor
MFRLFMGKAKQFLRKGLVFVINAYRYLISPLIGPRCRFEPTCSQYAIEALTNLGLTKAIFLILRRLLRCHPFCPGGYDPLVTTKTKDL